MKRLSLSLRATCPFTQRLLHICRFIGIHFEQHSLQHMDKLGSLQLLCIPRMFRSGVLPNIEFPIESWVDYNYGWSVISFFYIFIPLVIIYIYSDCGKQPLKKSNHVSVKCNPPNALNVTRYSKHLIARISQSNVLSLLVAYVGTYKLLLLV